MAIRYQGQDLGLEEQARRCCRVARQFEKAGEYGSACEALAPFWPDRDDSPLVAGLEGTVKAELLLRTGSLTGAMAGADQDGGNQEVAKNLITRGIEVFEEHGTADQVAGARGELGLCYWREGSYDEARIHF